MQESRPAVCGPIYGEFSNSSPPLAVRWEGGVAVAAALRNLSD